GESIRKRAAHCSSRVAGACRGGVRKMKPAVDPQRTIAELKELRAFTADANGAQRVAFTPTWVATREWLRKKLAPLPVETHVDAAGNLWSTLQGESDRALLIG